MQHEFTLTGPANERNRRKLEAIFAVVRSVPEAAEMLELADRLQTSIRLGNEKEMKGAYGVTRALNRDANSASEGHQEEPLRFLILLDETLPPKEAAITLAHELRHLWQGQFIPFIGNPRFPPRVAVVRERIVEGDARAFEAMFRARLHGRSFGTQDWTKAFNDFQDSSEAAGYDAITLKPSGKYMRKLKGLTAENRRDVLMEVFNISAAKGLEGTNKILVAGVSPSSPAYLRVKDADLFADSLLSRAPEKIRHKLAKLERTIRTGKY